MSEEDQLLWDRRHAGSSLAPVIEPPPPPPLFAHVEHLFPAEGRALDIACGRGEGAVWLAGRGLTYRGIDVSPVAIEMARNLIDAYGLTDRCRFDVWDLDEGLPPGDPVDLLFCHMFRDSRLDEALIQRVNTGGLLAVAALSEVGGRQGSYRAQRGELKDAFGHLEVLDEGEGEGMARILVRK